MQKLNDIEWQLADFLVENELNKRGNSTYTEIAEELSRRLHRNINEHFGLRYPLGNVSDLCFSLGLPLISARVIYKDATKTQAVADGFYSFACGYRPEYKSMKPIDAWKSELSLIRACKDWQQLRDYLDGKPVEVSETPLSAADKLAKEADANEEMPNPPESASQVSDPVFPDEVDTSSRTIQEGAVKLVSVNVRERSPSARQKCIEAHGTVCTVCRTDLGDIYGEEFSEKIHVHHLKPISEYDGVHDIDPVNDLCPVCPNCHMIIHCRQDKPYSIEEVRAFIASVRSKA